ncbi:cysteine hydrolase [Methylocella sp. CPCC 101449]|jgi:ureidoacrylate peracid hydrolase|uniref:cysteine hydrolase family protein n=1 Tax=Methylocella sp. CPCC 101449 TaxID=2987531 RepID=UPI00288F0649|nr:cysteine hydrolase [Methylocella sp. CPCC 101449]MDT2022555.1 cysteine hydrolase [Methylocella sp. CPCC 101449]HEV2572715.1 cysteine hydrolase [Beijerinckiaceae bacterium]
MNKTNLPAWAHKSAMRRRKAEHPHADLDPRKTALVVIDLQNAFMVKEHAVSLIPTALSIVDNVNRLATAVRTGGGKVYWIQNTFTPETVESWSNWFAMNLPEATALSLETQKPGSPGHALYAGLDVRPEDDCVEKTRFSAFIDGASNLPARLRAGGYNTVIIVGTVTNVCCESSARDAAMLNFKTVMVSDANATYDDDAHNAALGTFYALFGDVASTDEVIAWIEKNAAMAKKTPAKTNAEV